MQIQSMIVAGNNIYGYANPLDVTPVIAVL